MANTPWFLNPTLLPAAFGLIGVIVGGLITAGSAFSWSDVVRKESEKGNSVFTTLKSGQLRAW